MQIKSTFSDYYDKHQVYGHSAFIRNTLVKPFRWENEKRYRNEAIFQVGFCGEIYHGIYMRADRYSEHDYNAWQRSKKDHEECFIYNIDQYAAYEKEYWKYCRPLDNEDKRKLSRVFRVEKNDAPFIEHSAPIFLALHEIQFHTMGRPKIGVKREIYTLRKFQFEKIKPSHIAYMELEQYISGVLTREHKEIPEMDNSTKVASHGFDKTSFRKNK